MRGLGFGNELALSIHAPGPSTRPSGLSPTSKDVIQLIRREAGRTRLQVFLKLWTARVWWKRFVPHRLPHHGLFTRDLRAKNQFSAKYERAADS